MNKLQLIVVAVLLLVGAALGAWYWNAQKVAEESRAEVPAEEQTLGGALFQSVEEQQNPFKQAPEIAPLPAGTNPFKDAYRNPFAK